jgi:hypothetical protein
MNMLKKGPELKMPEKMPELKVPDFALDLYYDLKERHLLPLVAILLVALVALPIVLSSGSSESEPEPGAVAAPADEPLPSSKLIVAKAAPGLREYRKRLAGVPTDPFEEKFAESSEQSEGGESEASIGSSGGEEATSGGAESPSPESEPAGGSAPATPETTHTSPSKGNGEPSEGEQLRYYSFAIDVRITPVSSGSGAGESKAEAATVRHNLPELTMLPSRKEPALTFMDVSKDQKKVLMLVSDKVTGLFGDGACVVGAEHCQLLALEKGIPETVVYGADERTFRVELLKLRLLTTDKLNKAPLSKSEQKKKESGGGAGGKTEEEGQPAG